MSSEFEQLVASWRLDSSAQVEEQIEALLEPAYARAWLPDGHESVDAILLGEQYHLGGAEDTRRMADALAITASDRVVDLACYIGGPARQLARDYGCCVVGVDISPLHIEVAERLSQLCEFGDLVSFACASADAVPEPDGFFTVAWSQCSFPTDLSWLPEIDRLLAPRGRVGITGVIRRHASTDADLLSIEEMANGIAREGYRVISAEDISEMDLEFGWLPARRKLQEGDTHYRTLMGDEWVARAYRSLDNDIAQWREGRMGCGRVVAGKE